MNFAALGRVHQAIINGDIPAADDLEELAIALELTPADIQSLRAAWRRGPDAFRLAVVPWRGHAVLSILGDVIPLP
jgi:hypothetical protein